MSERYFLGINQGHTATAALVNDRGEIICAASEERFTGVKNIAGFPTESLRFLLTQIPQESVAGVGLPFLYLNPVTTTNDPFALHPYRDRWLQYIQHGAAQYARPLYERAYPLYNRWFSTRGAAKQRAYTGAALGLSPERVRSYHHHRAHAAAAYYCSPYNAEDALVLTLDGEGDGVCASVSTVRNGLFETIAQTSLGHSLGYLYMEATRYLGMKPNEHEYKVMGLAPYAKPEAVERVYRRIAPWIVVRGLRFESAFDTHVSYRMMKKAFDGVRFDIVAAAVQRLVEERMEEWVSEAVRETGLRTVCCGGGVFMNVKANKHLAERTSAERFWFMPGCGDESTAIGAALLCLFEMMPGREKQMKPIHNVYWGPSYTEDTIRDFLDTVMPGANVDVRYEEHIEEAVAELLAQKKVVARFTGKMEFGARALGNRSILAHPGDVAVVREINALVKQRDFWMPFAASMLRERADEYLVNPKRIASPFMMMSFATTNRAQMDFAAAMHPADHTVRPQIVCAEDNPSYHRLIQAFERRTGIGGILNTSFNLHGFPIVLGPREAWHAFMNSQIPYLAMENFLVCKKNV